MFYIAVGLIVYVLTAAGLLRGGFPETFREAIGGALACALVASMWPLALLWRALLGGGRPHPMQQVTTAPERSRSLGEA